MPDQEGEGPALHFGPARYTPDGVPALSDAGARHRPDQKGEGPALHSGPARWHGDDAVLFYILTLRDCSGLCYFNNDRLVVGDLTRDYK